MTRPSIDLIIVDDDARRSDDYIAFVKAFNSDDRRPAVLRPVICSTANVADSAIRSCRRPSMIILDMVLSTWSPNSISRLEATLQSSHLPIFALSGMFHDPEATSAYLKLTRRAKNSFIPILHWSTVEEIALNYRRCSDPFEPSMMATSGLEAFTMDLAALTQWNWSIRRSPDEQIRLLHLTDLHFSVDGDARERHINQIGTLLRSSERTADLVCVTGDSCDRGSISTFSNARNWIEGLFRNQCALDQEPVPNLQMKERVFICPGNHDFNEALAVSSLIERDPGSATGFSLPSGVSNVPRPQIDGAWAYGIAPFLRFHESVTDWRVSHGAFPGYRVVSRFATIGVHILELWAEEYCCGSIPSPLDKKWFDSVLAKFAQDIDAVSQANDCLIVLVHRFSLDSDDERATLLGAHLNSLSAKLRVIMLCGHYHVAEACPLPTFGGVLRIQGGSVAPNSNSDDQLSKLGVVSLGRKNGVVQSCFVERIERRNTGWTFTPERDFFAWDDGRWYQRPVPDELRLRAKD